MRLIIYFFIIFVYLSAFVQAKDYIQCDERYYVVKGDSLRRISKKIYRDTNLWPFIYYSNSILLNKGPDYLKIGQLLHIPCLTKILKNFSDAGEKKAGNKVNDKGKVWLKLLTGSDYKPFSSQNWLRGGMITDLVKTIFTLNYKPQTLEITWINDWSSHLRPLLSNLIFDAGFPWTKPNCEGNYSLSEDMKSRCTDFFFSDPIFVMLIVFYTRVDSSLDLKEPSELYGKKICRPKGYFTFDLEERNLIDSETITLVRPNTPTECFQMLQKGEVDTVSMNEMTGGDTLRELHLDQEIIPRIELANKRGLHLVVAKSHPKSGVIIEQFNNGLKMLQSSDQYDEIIARHLARFYRNKGKK